MHSASDNLLHSALQRRLEVAHVDPRGEGAREAAAAGMLLASHICPPRELFLEARRLHTESAGCDADLIAPAWQVVYARYGGELSVCGVVEEERVELNERRARAHPHHVRIVRPVHTHQHIARSKELHLLCKAVRGIRVHHTHTCTGALRGCLHNAKHIEDIDDDARPAFPLAAGGALRASKVAEGGWRARISLLGDTSHAVRT
mmetsp:Transcript_31628/g.73646  ORF Transcript_31628/g.73646 Transcript_31628/m.73646 type:complete len:204 (+) Transcript_31628:361-972(+)